MATSMLDLIPAPIPFFLVRSTSYIPADDIVPMGDRRVTKNKFKKLINKIFQGKIEGKLDLNGQGITDAHLIEILRVINQSRNSSISSLDLSSNLITEGSSKEISQFFKLNSKVSIINLSFNDINEAGAKYILEGLKLNTAIISLDFSGNHIPSLLIQELSQLIRRNLEFQNEKKHFPYYIYLAAIARIYNLPKVVAFIVMDYLNEASSLMGNNLVRLNLYPDAIKQIENLNTKSLLKITQKISLSLNHPNHALLFSSQNYSDLPKLKDSTSQKENENTRSKTRRSSCVIQ